MLLQIILKVHVLRQRLKNPQSYQLGITWANPQPSKVVPQAFQLNKQAFRSFFFFQLTSFSFRIVILHCCTVLFCFFKFCYFIVVCQTRLGVQFWPAEHAAPPLHWLSCWAGWVQSKWPSIHQLVLDHGHRAGPTRRRRGRRRIW